MITQLTVKEVLNRAIEKEIESQSLYTGLSRKMTDPAVKEALEKLSQQEKGHQTLLEKYLSGELKDGTLGHGKVVDYKIAEYLDRPKITLDMNLQDVFLMAANREKASHDFYLGLAGIHPEGEARHLLEDLASQELEHKKRVEFLYTEVAFPQTDGG